MVFPAILAGITIFLMATIWDIREHCIIFSSFGSSAFMIYTNPNAREVSTRNILGAYPLAGFFGYAAATSVPSLHIAGFVIESVMLAAAVAVGVTALAMLVTEFVHPPANGAALALVVSPHDVGAVFFLIGGGITLLILSKILRLIIKEERELECAVRDTFQLVKNKVE